MTEPIKAWAIKNNYGEVVDINFFGEESAIATWANKLYPTRRGDLTYKKIMRNYIHKKGYRAVRVEIREVEE